MGAFTRTDKAEIAASMQRVFARFPRLKERLGQLGGRFPAASSRCWLWGEA